MDLTALHIEYLLLRHDCVVIPDFGAFIKVRHSAWEDVNTGVLHPMTSEIRFNSLLSHDDGLLASSISRKSGISFSDGREYLRQAVNDMRDALKANGEITIGRLGVITLNENEKLSFHPLQQPEAVKARLGYISVPNHRNVAIADNDNRQTENTSTLATTPTSESSNPKEDTSKRTSRKFDTRRYYYIAVNKRLAHVAASLIAIIAIGISAYIPVNRYIMTDQASVMPVSTVMEVVQPVKPEPAAEAGKTENQEVAEEVKAKEQEKDKAWHLIVATFHSAEDAEKYIAANTDTGYSLSDISSKTMHRVSALSSEDKQELVHELNDKKFQEKFPQAWIYKVQQ